MNIKQALTIVGGLSNPSKMPCLGTSIPAQSCRLGSKLVAVPNSVCSGCYALKGAYSWKGVRDALGHRLDILQACEHDLTRRAEWIDAMAYLLNTRRAKWTEGAKSDSRYFRWFDSGDIQGLWHLGMIAEVASLTPDVAHWLPTRELPTVSAFLRHFGHFPGNLTVRLSANKVGAPLPDVSGTVSSGVHVTPDAPENGARQCPAVHNDNACGECRACWDAEVPRISYLKH